MKCWMMTVTLAVGLTFVAGVLPAEAGQTEPAVAKCPVTGDPVNLAASVPSDGGPVYFCCTGCIKKYEAEPGKYAAGVAAQRKALAGRPKVQVNCPVSGKPVDKKIFIESGDQKVYFCCPNCIKKFQSSPDKYKSALANSYTYQTKCPVRGEDIDPASFTDLPTGERIYYCCMGCDKKLLGDPDKYNQALLDQSIEINWAKVHKATEDEHGAEDGHDHAH